MGNCFLHGQPGGTSLATLASGAIAAEILLDKEAYDDDGIKITGTMPNRGEVDTDITTKAQVVTIAAGYHNGSGTVQIDSVEQGKLIAANVASGVTILGVAGSHAGAPVMDGTATVGQVLSGSTFYNTDPATKETGTMTNVGAQTATISTVAGTVTPTQGYHSGAGSISIDAGEQAKAISGNIRSGVTLLGVAGDANVVNTSSGDAIAADLLSGKKAWVDGAEVTGSMTNRGEVDTDITAVAQTVTIAAGYHNGSGTVQINATDQGKLIAENIATGISILGVNGSHSGSSTLTGDAVVGQVLAGATFYKDDAATKLTGTMTDRTGDTACLSSSVSGTTLKLLASDGYRDGVNDNVTLTDADFTAANIKDGVNVFGIAGTYNPSLSDLLSDAIVVKTRDASTYALTVDFYGTVVPIYGFYGNATSNLRYINNITFKHTVTELKGSAFRSLTTLTSAGLPDLSNVTTLTGGATFRDCTALTTIAFPKVAVFNADDFRSCTALTTVTLGSIGYPVTTINVGSFTSDTQAGLTINIYVTPGDQPLANSPWGATSATIVYKSAVDGSDL